MPLAVLHESALDCGGFLRASLLGPIGSHHVRCAGCLVGALCTARVVSLTLGGGRITSSKSICELLIACDLLSTRFSLSQEHLEFYQYESYLQRHFDQARENRECR